MLPKRLQLELFYRRAFEKHHLVLFKIVNGHVNWHLNIFHLRLLPATVQKFPLPSTKNVISYTIAMVRSVELWEGAFKRMNQE